MNQKAKWTFLALVLVQSLHSIEEYIGELWANFPPATYLCSLVSDDLETGFLYINIGLFLFGVLSWYFIIRKDLPIAKIILGFWIGIEIMNGIGHPIWTFMQKQYTPGVITAPFLLLVAIYLIVNLKKESN